MDSNNGAIQLDLDDEVIQLDSNDEVIQSGFDEDNFDELGDDLDSQGNDQNNQQEEVSIHENLILGGTSNTHQPTKKGFIDLLNGQFSGVNDPNQVMGSWPNMSAPPGSIAGFGYLRHQSMSYDSYHQPSLQGYAPHFPSGYLTQKSREEIYAPFHLPTPRGYNPFFQRLCHIVFKFDCSSLLIGFNCLQILGNTTGSISSKLGESQSSQVLANATRSISSMLSESQLSQTVSASSIPDGWMGLDIGFDSIKTFNEALDTTKTII
ncbi:hypothetical protein GIB67_001773 [Kingdonia uniflora]|uniref:phosphoglycerate kinase n=1 Tax=Kingdonia uniflora TaxID=39325 RepID=A0A7J7LBV2_9MAGN|nr:hypothetical protein GIB67_001773 [Kingdonia uniflora]